MSCSAPKISVIIPSYNSRNWIRETLLSVRAQDCGDIEVIVVDDGSTDDSAHIVAREFPSINLVCAPNGGPSRARNLGIELATGELFQFLDSDDLLPKRKLEKQACLLAATGADVAYGDWYHLRADAGGTFKSEPVVARELQGDPSLALFGEYWYPIHSYLFRRRIVETVGGFNETLPIIQDARFALDCALHGAKFVYSAGDPVPYRMHSAGQNSKRDPSAFVRDCFTNAAQVQAWWDAHGGITSERRQALLKVYGGIARGSYEHDSETFDAALKRLDRLCPGYTPSSPPMLVAMSRMVGYRHAERLALHYRKLKRALLARHTAPC